MRTRTSPTGRPAHSRGFTLVELLVALAILALLTALAAPMISSAMPGAALKAAARDVADGLRQVRSDAIVNNAEKSFLIDVERRQAILGDEGGRLSLPPGVDLRVIVGDSEVASASAGGIRFYPDGSSTGGRITLRLDDSAYDVSVDWLGGRIQVEGPRAAAP